MQAEAYKHCPTCGETKPIDEFSIARDRSDGRHWRCRECDCGAARSARRLRRDQQLEAEAITRAATVAAVDSDFGHWLAGFIDGEGHFAIKGTSTRTGRPNYTCAMQIGLRDDDRGIIEEIHMRTGIGKLYTVPARRSVVGGIQRAAAVWLVMRKGDCLTAVAILDRFPLRAKKARDYAIWREAVLLWADVLHQGCRHRLDPHDWTAIADLKRRLQEGRAYR